MWRQVQAGQFVVVTSESSATETLVKPLRDSDAVLQKLLLELFDSNEARLIPTTRTLWEEA